MKYNKKGIIGITFAAIMIASIFAMVAPSTVAEGPNQEAPEKTTSAYPNSTIRIYGEVGFAPDTIYTDWQDPFDPTVIPKDSITFNPAIQIDMEPYSITSPEMDLDLKTHLRMWYEPSHVYEGLISDYTLQTHSCPTIEVEYTYIFVDNLNKTQPAHVGVGGTFPFPIAEITGQTGLGSVVNEVPINDEPYEVIVTAVGGPITDGNNKTTNGTIQIMKTVYLNTSEKVQFMDHKMKFIGTDVVGSVAVVDIWYAGNGADDTKKRVTLDKNQLYYFDRHNRKYDTGASHPDRTWKVRFVMKMQDTHVGVFDIGKELRQGDTFYVDGVRYDIPAIEAIDTTGNDIADEVKYITIRTPLPKCPDPTKTTPKRDDSVVSSQWLDCIYSGTTPEIIPLLPPFNEVHDMVDDIDIPLWAPTKHQLKWPEGDMDAPDTQLGIAKFPCAERYLTQQYPPAQWLTYFAAVPIKRPGGGVGIVRQGPHHTTDGNIIPCDEQLWDNYGGPFYPGDEVPEHWMMATCGKILDGPGENYSVFDVNDWIAIDIGQRIIPDVEKTEVYYVSEGKEERYSTDLLEKLKESYIGTSSLYENWTKFDIQTLPDRYTEFVVPQVPDLNVTNCEDQDGEFTQMMFGDYLITTSLIAPNARGDFPDSRVAFSYDQLEGMGGIDIYVNDAENTGNNTVRVYGDVGLITAPAYDDDDWEAPFNPAWIRKDSITFDPAILEWDGQEYPMSAQSVDSDLKKYLRMWYEPCYPFQHGTDKRPAIVLETTYMLIEDKHKMPWHGSAGDTWFAFPIAENESTDQVGLELFENVLNDNVTPYTKNLVALSYVAAGDGDNIGAYNKTTNGTIRIEKKYELASGETIQFLDHKLTFEGTDVNGTIATVRLQYAGNKDDDPVPGTIKVLPKDQTIFFDRHHTNSSSASHPKWTWYAKFQMKMQDTHHAAILVGKELSRDDVFYVDAVRYEVEAIEVLDLNGDGYAEKFKYITIRTPLPKELDGNSFAAIIADKNLQVQDDWLPGGPASSIWIVPIPPCHTIPVNPPFNMNHSIVDDTDVQLWVPLKHFDKWNPPLGDPHGGIMVEYFPNGERYLTMQEPPEQWLKYFRAVPIGVSGVPCDWQLWDNYGGPFYPTKMGKDAEEQWIANDVSQRIVTGVAPLDFCWLYEQKEPRYSTNLLQILDETFDEGTGFLIGESWTKYDIQTLPDQFTEFRLPKMPDKVIWHYPCDQNPTKDYDALKGSYLVTTSFIAPNAEGDLNLNQSYYEENRFAFIYDVNLSANYGLYMNEDPVYAERENVTQFDLKEGWNLISLNVLPEDRSVDAIFGHEIYWYDPVSGWQTPSVVEAGKGYFVYSAEDTTVTIATENSEVVELTWEEIEATLGDGWNLVGPGVMPISAPASDYYVYEYKDNDYSIMYPADTLNPGEGYWILKTPSTP